MINHLDLQGRMVADPEIRQTDSGSSVANFRVAWSEKYKERENKLFLECKAFGAQADFLGKYFKKGQEICVEGKLNTEEWEKDGQKRSKVVLVVNNVHFCGKKEDNGGSVQPNMTPVNIDESELPF
jgi:single-strand DNA-binding protein